MQFSAMTYVQVSFFCSQIVSVNFFHCLAPSAHSLVFNSHWFLASSGELSPWNDVIKRDKNKPIGEGGWVNYF